MGLLSRAAMFIEFATQRILPVALLFSLHIVMHFENISIPNFCKFGEIRHFAEGNLPL
jgi:hypothetical protein